VTVRVGVLDYGSGNLHSVCRALDAAGARVTLSSARTDLATCQGLVLPGVGAFAACMDGLRACGGAELVADWAGSRRPLLGICVGHQVLFDSGVEHGVVTDGLGLLPGLVGRLEAKRLPHMGWNTVEASDCAMFGGLTGEHFYFCHSYGVRRLPPGLAEEDVIWCNYEGTRFVAAVAAGHIWSTQFHPEKSGAAGGRLLSNWLDIASSREVDHD